MSGIKVVYTPHDVVSFKTGKLNSNAATTNGIYPFFTCSQVTFRTDTYSFDDECVLLGGNNANGIYPLKYFKGKFDAYQRTYVIRTLDNQILSNYYLFFTLQQKLDLFKRLSTGAATKFLTLTILKDIEIICPPISLQCKFSNLASNDLINNLESKNANLRRTRDLLLPKLISGEVGVDNSNMWGN